MRLTIWRRLIGVVSLLGLLGLAISVFAIFQLQWQNARTVQMERAWNAGLQARTLAALIDHAVAASLEAGTSDDASMAKVRFEALRKALDGVEQQRAPFAEAMAGEIDEEEVRRIDLAVQQFIAFQKDIVEMGLTISAKAAMVQATDDATLQNRIRMVAQINQLGRAALERLDGRRQEAVEASERSRFALLFVPTIALALGIMSALWLMRLHIQRPLQTLRRSMLALAEDNLDAEVPFADRRDEIGEMANAIAVFRGALIEKRTLDASVAEQHERENRRASQLAEATREFRVDAETALEGLTVSASGLRDASQALAGMTVETGDRAVAAASASHQTAGAVNKVASAAEQLSQSARQIAEQVQHAETISTNALVNTRELETTISTLSRAAADVGDVVNLIENIANQTNLLALNATIEAARAGAAGRGFSVVAAEVKALSHQTAQATGVISERVQAIQSVADGASGAIDEIAQTIASMSRIATQVARNASEQGEASTEIARAIGTVAVDVGTISESAAGIRTTADLNATEAMRVRSDAGKVDESVDMLQKVFDRFIERVRVA